MPFLLSILQQTQTIVTLACALAILHLRNAHSVYFALGATMSAVIAKLLKRVIKQPRPEEASKTTYGMPSTHSASIGFMGTYLILCALCLWPHPRLSRFITPERWSWPDRLISASLAALLALSVWWSRIRLGYHTKAQVMAGGSLGSVCAIAAFVLWHGSQWTQERTSLLPVRGIPAAGLQEHGWVFERAVEDLAFVALDSWETRDPGLLLDGVHKAVLAVLR